MRSETSGQHESHEHARSRGGMSYWRFAAMIATAVVVMYGVMYIDTYALDEPSSRCVEIAGSARQRAPWRPVAADRRCICERDLESRQEWWNLVVDQPSDQVQSWPASVGRARDG